jgi:CarboxypepD_reg-like domain
MLQTLKSYEMKKIFTLLLTLLTSSFFAQQTITGTVTNEKGEPLVGASVWIKGTTQGTLADSNGNYVIKTALYNAFLSFSFAGMQPYTKEIGDSKTINAVLGETTLPEFVAVGYGSCIRTCKSICSTMIEYNSFSAQYTTFTDKSTLTFQILGNPFTDRFALDIKSLTDEKAVIAIHNIEGKLIKTLQTNLYQGENRVEICDLNHLLSGLYTVSINLIQQKELPQVIEKSIIKTIPNELFKKIKSLYPEYLKYPNNKVLPLSKEQYQLLIQSNKLAENIGKVKTEIAAINPKYDSWDIETDAIVEEADEDLYPHYKKVMTQIFNEYREIMTHKAFKAYQIQEEYDIEDFDMTLLFEQNAIQLVQKEVIKKKIIYSQIVVKM